MADKVKFSTGLEKNLPTTKESGKVYFATNDNNEGSIYFDKDSDTRVKMTTAARGVTVNGVEKGSVNLDESSNPTLTLKSNTFVVGTGTTAGTWTGSLFGTGITELYDGLIIDYWMNIGGASGGTTLNLNLSDGSATGAKNVYFNGASRLTTHYSSGNIVRMVYRSSVTINGTSYTGWWITSQFYIDNTYIRYSLGIKANTAITSNNIIVGTDSGYNNLNSGKAFDITYPIYWAGSNIAASGIGYNNYLMYSFNFTNMQAVSSFDTTPVAYKPMYIKGTLSGNTFTPISTTPLTQTTSDTNYSYMLLGMTYSTTNMCLIQNHPIYATKNGTFGEIVNYARNTDYATGDSTTIRSKYVSGVTASGQTVTVTKGDGSTSTLTTQDKNVTQTVTSTNANYEVLFSNTADNTTRTEGARKNSNLTFNPSTGTLTTTKFSGSLSGNATTASTWETARTFRIKDTSGDNSGPGVDVNGNGEVNLYLPSTIKASITGHASEDLPLAGGTMNHGAQIGRTGSNVTWINGRNGALIRSTTVSGYSPLASIKTTNGSWEIGAYDYAYYGYSDDLIFTYCTDANYDANNNAITTQIRFSEEGGINPSDNNRGSIGASNLKWANMYATTFNGDLNGLAAKATSDSAGQNIASTYIKSVNVSDEYTLSTTNGVGSTTTIGNFVPLNSSKLIDLKYIPQAALERLTVVADDTARLALTTSTVQNGDVVKVTSTGKMYFVKDETKLTSEDGYEVFTAGTASAVAWGNVTGKPTLLGPNTTIALGSNNTSIVLKRYDSNGAATGTDTTISPAFLPLAGGTMTGNITFSKVNIGLYGKDAAGRTYALAKNNETNFWLGAASGTSTAHTGNTYISTGWDATNKVGYRNFRIAVPTLADDGTWSNVYYIPLDNGNYTNYVYSKSTSDGKYLGSIAKATSTGTEFSIKGVYANSKDGSSVTIPNASASVAGLITTGAQTLTGAKTIDNSGSLTINTTSGFNYAGIEAASSNAARPVWFAYSGVNGKPVYNSNFTYNPSTKTLVVENISGTASKATSDSAGNNINTTYLKDLKQVTSNGTTFTFRGVKGSGSDGTLITVPAASTSVAGLVTTGGQIFAGSKVFSDRTRLAHGSYVSGGLTGTNGTKGYVKIAQIKITGTYANQPIVLELAQRSYVSSKTLYIRFTSVNSTDPDLNFFTYSGDVQVNAIDYLYKSDTSTWDLYVTKTEAYDYIEVLRYHLSTYMNGLVTLTWTNELATEVPSGAIAATRRPFDCMATRIYDSNNGYSINVTYSKNAQSSTSYLASWNGYELGAISPNNITAGTATKLKIYESRNTTTDLNKTAAYGGAGSLFHLIASSATTANKCPTDANILQMNWDNSSGWDSQLAVSSSYNSRLYFRSCVNGTWKSWREAASIPAGTQVGDPCRPVYVNDLGQVNVCSYRHGINTYYYSGSLSSGGWKALNGTANWPVLTIAYNNNPASWNSNTYSASLVWGVNDTRGLLDCSHNTPMVVFGGGSGGSSDDSPNWYMKLKGTSAKTYDLDSLSASKLATARTITLGAGLTGSVSFDGSSNVTLNGWLKHAYQGDDNSDYASYAWHKIAEITISTTYTDSSASWYVTNGYTNTCSGILRARVRTGGTKTAEVSACSLQWNFANSGISVNDFVLVYTDTADTSSKFEIWVKQVGQHRSWLFTTIHESDRRAFSNLWTMYSGTGHGSASYTSGTGTIISELGAIANTSAKATVLETARTIQTNLGSTSSASFNGSANITPGITGTLAVGHGGTGATTFTSGYALIGNGTSAIATRAITNNTSVSAITASTNLITANTLAYWNGAYSGTSSNLTYLGTIKNTVLNLTPPSGEGGEIHLNASTANTAQAGIILDQLDSKFRIFGIPSADGTTKTGNGTPLVIDPYNKSITGGYTITGTLSGNASTATLWQNVGANCSTAKSTWNNSRGGTIVYGQSWKSTAYTYTPSGGSATTITDSGDVSFYVKAGSTTSNVLTANMAIDGEIFAGTQVVSPIVNATSYFSSPYLIATSAMSLSGGKVSALATATSRLYSNGLAISNPATANDQGWIRVTGTSESDTVLEIATGDDGGAGEQIVARQYNTSNAVAHQITLLDTSGYTTLNHLNVGYTNTSYDISTGSLISNSWVRTKGSTGWYSEDYGGGWYMTDTSWIRTYGNKSIYQNTGTLRTDGTLQVGSSGTYFQANSSGVTSSTNFTLNRTSTQGGYYLQNSGTTYARAWVSTIGTAGDGTNTGTTGYVYLQLGNDTSVTSTSGSGANNATGRIRLYGSGSYYQDIIPQPNGSNRSVYLPNYAGTMYLIHGSSNSAIGSSTKPVYIAANGRATACTYSLSSTVNSGTTSHLAYYSASGAISSASNMSIDNDENRLTVTSASGDYSEFTATRTGGSTVWMGVGSGNTNHGLYSDTLNKWMVYADSSNVYLKGNADTATTLSSTLAVSLGGTGKTSWTANRLIYSSAATTLANATMYCDGTHLGVNSTTTTIDLTSAGAGTPTHTLYVGGSGYFSSFINISGNIAFVGSNRRINTTYDGSTYNVLRMDHGSGNVSLNAASGNLYLGWTTTNAIILGNTSTDGNSANFWGTALPSTTTKGAIFFKI